MKLIYKDDKILLALANYISCNPLMMKLLIVLLAFTSAVLGKSLSVNSSSNATHFYGHDAARIINGNTVAADRFPWQVGIFPVSQSGSTLCGGALISDLWVLTAAHCIHNAASADIFMGIVNMEEDGTRMEIPSSNLFTHPEYDRKNLLNDIGLIKLTSKVASSNSIRPITLARSDSTLNQDVEVIASGWGQDAPNGDISVYLKYVSLKTIANTQCSSVYGSTMITDNVVCASTTTSGVCDGDSGSPLITNNGGNYVAVAIGSFVYKDCKLGFPVGFTRVSKYISYINSVTGLSLP